MSRSKKGSKSPGYDYWSKRPASGMGFGPEVKKITKRTERRIADREIKRDLRKLESKKRVK